MDEKAQLQQRIYDLTSQLTSSNSDCGDWKIIKCYEYALQNLPLPYNLEELHAKRQAIREEINNLQEKLSS